jgi:inner membrane transporter RhtA
VTDVRTDTVPVRPAGGPARRYRGGRTGAVALVLSALLSQELGAASAVQLFPRVGAVGVASLRLAISAALLLAGARPRVRGRGRADWALIGAYGVTTATMNMLFYQAIARIPLAAAVTLEVLGPLALSVATGRRVINGLWAVLALAGVAALGRAGMHGLNLAGAAFALGSAVMWAGYILLAARAGSRFPRIDGLALAMAIGGLLSLPFGAAGAGLAIISPGVLLAAGLVAVLSAALPYTLELLSLRRLSAPTFATLMSLGPAIAAAVGYLVLHQTLTAAGGIAIILIITASVGAVRTSPSPRG